MMQRIFFWIKIVKKHKICYGRLCKLNKGQLKPFPYLDAPSVFCMIHCYKKKCALSSVPETFEAFTPILTLKRKPACGFYTACRLPFSVNLGIEALKVSGTGDGILTYYGTFSRFFASNKTYYDN